LGVGSAASCVTRWAVDAVLLPAEGSSSVVKVWSAKTLVPASSQM
jgi:hypothetical protein